MRIPFFSESSWSHGTVPQGSPGFQVYIVEQTTARVRKRQLLKRSDLRMIGGERLTCEVCGQRFTQVSNLTRHVDQFHLSHFVTELKIPHLYLLIIILVNIANLFFVIFFYTTPGEID